MYIVVKEKTRISTSLYFYLVESVRGPDGPRQKDVAYLGGIKQELQYDFFAGGLFWKKFLEGFTFQMAIHHIAREKQEELISLVEFYVPIDRGLIDSLWKVAEIEAAHLAAMRERIMNEA
jgi:hypothetical protein